MSNVHLGVKRFVFFTALLVATSVPNPVTASSEDSCGFGYVLRENYDSADNCEKSNWQWLSDSDGFSSYIAVYMDADVVGYEDGIEVTTTMMIICEKRSLGAYISTDPLDMYPDTNSRGVGVAQVRVDSKKVQNFSYMNQSDYSGITFSNPKKVTSAILSGKTKVRVKIGTMNGYNVSAFPKADLATYVSKFKKKGCPLK